MCKGGDERLYAPFLAQCCDAQTEAPTQSMSSLPIDPYSSIHVHNDCVLCLVYVHSFPFSYVDTPHYTDTEPTEPSGMLL